MRLPPRPLRRVVIDPAWVLLAAPLAAVLSVVAALGLAVMPLSRTRRVPRLACYAAVYLLVDAGIIVGCAVLWLWFLVRGFLVRGFLARGNPARGYPARARRGPAWAGAHQEMLGSALRLLVSASRPLLGFEVQLEEAPEAASLAGRPLLVLARHGGPGDSFAIAELLLSRYGRRPVIVLKESLRWDPGLDVLLSRMPCCFLPARATGEDRAGRIGELAAGLAETDAMLIFPEGGNWTPRRHLRALNRLRARGRRVEAERAAANPHVLPPQPAGVQACLTARPDLGVLIVAHTGLDDLVSPALVWQALPVGGRPMVMRWWRPPPVTPPATATRLGAWLDVQWAIVDSWIDARKAARQRTSEPAAAGSAAPEASPSAPGAPITE
jgi:1-acyl-sn-glycerol-3-phosphate acyltransferase